MHRKHVSQESLSLENELFWDDQLNKKTEKLATQRRLYGILAALPDVLNTAILLRYFSNYQTYEEIAAILHIPVGTVRSRLSQAKKKLGEYWRQPHDISNTWFLESEEWNTLYSSMYGGMHEHDTCKNKFVSHIRKGCIIFPNGKRFSGSDSLENMVQEDRKAGSWLEPVNIISSGSISIIESVHFNSADHPQHCPARSVMVLFREGRKASRLFLHV